MRFQIPANIARAHREPFIGDEIRVLLMQKSTGAKPCYAQPVVFSEMPDDALGACLHPTFSLTPDAAQQLIDELWRAGLRPTEGSGSAGSLAATERHLEDMRALVFKTSKPTTR